MSEIIEDSQRTEPLPKEEPPTDEELKQIEALRAQKPELQGSSDGELLKLIRGFEAQRKKE